MDETSSHFPNGAAKNAGHKVQWSVQEFIEALLLDVEGSECRNRKVLEVLHHDHIAPAGDSRRKYIPVIRIRGVSTGIKAS